MSRKKSDKTPADQTSGKGKPKAGRAERIYAALVAGAKDGLAGETLDAHVCGLEPDVTGKRVLKACLRAFGDAALTDKSVLDAVYAVYLRHRLPVVATIAEPTEVEIAEDGAKKKRGKKAG